MPQIPAERAIYRASLLGLVRELLLPVAWLEEAPPGTPHPDLAAVLEVSPAEQLRFTADGWARLCLLVVPTDAAILRRRANRLHGPAPATLRLPLHARIAQLPDGATLAVDWQCAWRSAKWPRPFPDHGTSTAGGRSQTIALSLPSQLAAAGEVAETLAHRRSHRPARPPGPVTVQEMQRPQGPAPVLRLSGHWLAELGFHPRERVTVATEPGRIVLSLDSSDIEQPPETAA